MIDTLLILDTETTGLSPDKDSLLIEIAAVLYSIKYKTVLQSFATLLPCYENPVEHINHIKPEATQCDYAFRAKTDKEVFEDSWKQKAAGENLLFDPNGGVALGDIIVAMNGHAQACVAHNAEFDKRFIATQSWGHILLANKWICTKANFTWPVPLQRLRQQDICEAMGVPYINAHRALADCLLLAQCFSNVEDLQARIDRC